MGATDVIEVATAQQTNCIDCGLYVLEFTRRLCSLLHVHLFGHGGCRPTPPGGSSLPVPVAKPGITRKLLEAELASAPVHALRPEILKLIQERSLGNQLRECWSRG
jgi:hypothetical protein